MLAFYMYFGMAVALKRGKTESANLRNRVSLENGSKIKKRNLRGNVYIDPSKAMSYPMGV